ncbi:MAG: hypothetical protein QXG02_04340 [Candidatus Anstonellales archaeon]
MEEKKYIKKWVEEENTGITHIRKNVYSEKELGGYTEASAKVRLIYSVLQALEESLYAGVSTPALRASCNLPTLADKYYDMDVYEDERLLTAVENILTSARRNIENKLIESERKVDEAEEVKE